MYRLCNEVTDFQFWLKFGGKFEFIGTPKGPFSLVSRNKALNKVSQLSYDNEEIFTYILYYLYPILPILNVNLFCALKIF